MASHFSLLTFCALLVAAAAQGDVGNAQYCLKLLRSENRAETVRGLLTCVEQVKKSEERSGRQFRLTPAVYEPIGKCLAVQVGVMDASGRINKPELERRIRANRQITEGQRQRYLGLLPTCNDWDNCLRQECRV